MSDRWRTEIVACPGSDLGFAVRVKPSKAQIRLGQAAQGTYEVHCTQHGSRTDGLCCNPVKLSGGSATLKRSTVDIVCSTKLVNQSASTYGFFNVLACFKQVSPWKVFLAGDADGVTAAPLCMRISLPEWGGASREASPQNVEETESADTFVIAQVLLRLHFNVSGGC
jgi:hypothetical protein